MKYFDSVIGYEDIKLELARVLDTIRYPNKYRDLGVKTLSGVLLYGEPGVGKTMFSTAFLKAAERPSFVCRKDKPNGEFVNEIKNVFEKAMEAAPSIVLLDDMDKFANEDYSRSDAEEYITIQSCIDTIKTEGKDVFVFATANNMRKLPSSLVRAGRFDKVIEMKVPAVKDAAKIIQHYLSDKKVVDNLDFEELARILQGHSCAELESIINEAGIYSGYDNRECISRDDILRSIMRGIFDAPESVEPIIPRGLSIEMVDFLSKCLVRNYELRWTAKMLLDHPFLKMKMHQFKYWQGSLDYDIDRSMMRRKTCMF